ncbi:hypothetical protein G3T36_02450 [Diaminobutyricibacter tongyongensis]|uniref:Uncharacterized protein n=1 Tax=Leifsonia tongyongensis TaxID=1268043 RepID=A0A6L9XTJ3_9MICO|nr:hypothetical protein [Diaminobutyricibacter tongyongensis]NEN04721.1 hypothetical protein [Diaminobutyricibacter tongyongensis]
MDSKTFEIFSQCLNAVLDKLKIRKRGSTRNCDRFLELRPRDRLVRDGSRYHFRDTDAIYGLPAAVRDLVWAFDDAIRAKG